MEAPLQLCTQQSHNIAVCINLKVELLLDRQSDLFLLGHLKYDLLEEIHAAVSALLQRGPDVAKNHIPMRLPMALQDTGKFVRMPL